MELAVLFLPLLGAVLAGLLGPKLGDKFACWVSCLALLATAAFGCALFYDVSILGHARQIVIGNWIDTPAFSASWSLNLDPLSTIMIAVVSVVSALVHIYSVGYMAEDRARARFMSFLGFFTFFMLMLVSASDLLQLFFGWEGVGLMSYLLIGFWYEKPRAAAAGVKAFLMNRIGDFGFMLGIFACARLFGSLSFQTLFEKLPEAADISIQFFGHEIPALTLTCCLLLCGAVAKSAQVGLHTWLPDAMEGPTPVSALIHAATMVTAGVFMIVRLHPLFETVPDVMIAIGWIGAITALFAGLAGTVQSDIKRVIAYSTMSQLGYMFMALGVGAFGAAVFHLATHAFFKALLFLGAGSVIHALHGEQDLRAMGGLWKKLPVTYAFMLIGSLALMGLGVDGVFGFAGFYSKELILRSAFAAGGDGVAFYWVGVLAAYFTAFYSLRLILLAFHGKPTAIAGVHEAPWIMSGPLVPLALGAIGAGYLGVHWFEGAHALFPSGEISVSTFIASAPLLFIFLGLAEAALFYAVKPELPVRILARMGRAIRFVAGGYGIDTLYDVLFVRPVEKLGRVLWHAGDEKLIDTLGPDGIGHEALRLGRRVSSFQTGFVYHYAFAMAAGVALFVAWFLLV